MQTIRFLSVALAVVLSTSCATLQQIAALESVDFQLDRVADVEVAGIEASRISSYSDLGLSDAATLGAMIARRELPVSFRVHIIATNPSENPVTARLIRMQWTLFLEDTETISGLIEQEHELPPGQPTDIPVNVSLDLFDFFERSGPDLFNLALNLAGVGGNQTQITLRALPTVNTALGPISYTQPITIVDRSVGR